MIKNIIRLFVFLSIFVYSFFCIEKIPEMNLKNPDFYCSENCSTQNIEIKKCLYFIDEKLFCFDIKEEVQ